MALQIALPGPRGTDVSYWAITRICYDKDINTTTIELGGWESQSVREHLFPVADMRDRITVEGSITDLTACYSAVKADPKFSSATDLN